MLKRGDIIVIDRSWAVERINKKAGSEVCALKDPAKVASHKKAGWLRVRILKNGHVCSVRNIVDCYAKDDYANCMKELEKAKDDAYAALAEQKRSQMLVEEADEALRVAKDAEREAAASILEFHPAPSAASYPVHAPMQLPHIHPFSTHSLEVLLKDTLDCLKKTTDRKEILRIVADHLMIEGTEQDHLVAGKVLNKTLNWWEQPRRGVRGKVICTCGVIGQSYMTS